MIMGDSVDSDQAVSVDVLIWEALLHWVEWMFRWYQCFWPFQWTFGVFQWK